MVGTYGVQHLTFDLDKPYLPVTAMEDILKYLSLEIVTNKPFAYFERDEAPPQTAEQQVFHNGILLSGLLEEWPESHWNEGFEKILRLANLIKHLLSEKLKEAGLELTHEAKILTDEEYGDLIVTFIKIL